MGINTFPNNSFDWSAYTQHRRQRTIDLTANVYTELLNVTGKGYVSFCFAYFSGATNIQLLLYIDGTPISWSVSSPYNIIGVMPLMPSAIDTNAFKLNIGNDSGYLNGAGYDYDFSTNSSLDKTLSLPLFFNNSCIITLYNQAGGITNYSYNVGVIA